MAQGLQTGNRQQILHLPGQLSKAVRQLILHVHVILIILYSRDPLIGIQLLSLVGNIAIGNECIDGTFHLGIEAVLFGQLALLLPHRHVQKLAVELVTHRLHVAVLLRTQHISGAPDLQIPHGDADAGAELGEFPDGLQPLLRFLGEELAPPIHKEGIGSPVGTAYPSSELIELRKSHAVRTVDNQRIGIGNVQPRFNDGGGHQHVDFAVDKLEHDLLQLGLRHLPMGIGHPGLRRQGLNLRSRFRNVVDAIVYKIHLTAPGQLPADGLAHQLLVVLHHIGLHRNPVDGRLLQHRHIPDSHQRHVKRPGNGRRRQSQHIHVLLQALDPFLVGHAEALFLVHDQKSQILVLHVLGQ